MKINSVPVCYTHCPKSELVGWGYDSLHRHFGWTVYIDVWSSLLFWNVKTSLHVVIRLITVPRPLGRGCRCAGKNKFFLGNQWIWCRF